MKQHPVSFTLTLATLSWGMAAFVLGQAPAASAAKKPAEPQVEIRPAQPEPNSQKLQIRSAALPSAKSKGAAPLGVKEQNIVKNLPNMTDQQLREMTEIYNRVGNQRMATMLLGELTRRDPKAADLATLQSDLLPEGVDDDPEATKAQELHAAGKSREAASVLQRLKNEKYRGKPFRYQQDLAYALMESGQEQAAVAAFRELLTSSTISREEKSEVSKTLAGMALEALQAKGQAALTARDARRAMEVANQLLEKNPNDQDGMALKIGAMTLTGHGEEAIKLLEAQKAAAGSAPFVHQKTLADAYYDLQNLPAAQSAYQAILDHPGSSAEDLAEARVRLQDLHRDRLLQQGELALRAGKLSKAETIAVQLELERPVHPDAKAFRASVLNKQGRYSEAQALLESLKNDPKNPFDANADLAAVYINTGNWTGAVAEFAVAENDPKNSPSERFEAARLGREIMARYRPTHGMNLDGVSGAEGTLWRASTESSTGDVGGGNIFLVRANWDQVHLNSTRQVARQDADRFQAEVVYRRLISNGFFGEAGVGGSDEDVVYSAKVGRYEGPGLNWELSYRGNDRATNDMASDSLALEALNGRQNIATLYVGTRFSKNFYLDSRVFYREVTVGGQSLGRGWGFDMDIGYTFLEETNRRPELAVSYFNEICFFSHRDMGPDFDARYGRKGNSGNISRSLIDRAVNRHGFMITATKQFNSRFSGYVYAGASYEFVNRLLEGRVGAGLEAYLAENMSLIVGTDFTTSGNAGNRGDSVISGNVGVKVSF